MSDVDMEPVVDAIMSSYAANKTQKITVVPIALLDLTGVCADVGSRSDAAGTEDVASRVDTVGTENVGHGFVAASELVL